MTPETAARFAAPATTLCHAWRLTLSDGTALGFTDHDRTLRLGDLDYEPGSGLSASEARDSAGLATASSEVSGALSSDRIREEDLVSGRFDGAQVETMLVDWQAPEHRVTLRVATIGKVGFADGAFIAELESRSRDFDQPRGRYYRRGCDAEFGDLRCGVDAGLAVYRGAGTVAAVDGTGMLTVNGIDGHEEGWFTHGMASFGGGALMRVSAHRRNGSTTTLTLARPATIAPGAVFTLVAGCDKRFGTCREKFANILNFRGFPHLPGNDAAYAYATEDAVFDGAPLTP